MTQELHKKVLSKCQRDKVIPVISGIIPNTNQQLQMYRKNRFKTK